MNQASTGHQAWDVESVDMDAIRRVLLGMSGSLVVRYGKVLLQRLPAEPSCIEIGSGLGKLSLLLAMTGARPSLLDSSAPTLEQARAFFADMKVPVETVVGDALDIPPELEGKFNLSMSLGVNEHFRGAARQGIFDAHAKVLQPGGCTLIGVPNRHCLSYRIALRMWKWTGRWPHDLYEYGFSRRELVRRMRDAGFADISVVSGTRPGADFRHYIWGNLRAAVRKLLRWPAPPSVGRARVTTDEIRTALDRAPPPERLVSQQSYMWLAMGRKGCSR